MTDQELKNACIYDLTTDEKLLREIMGLFDHETIPTRKEYLDSVLHETRIFDMLEYADDIMNNKELTEQLKKVFKEDLEAFFNE